MTLKQDLIKAIEEIPEDGMSHLLSDVLNYLHSRLNRANLSLDSSNSTISDVAPLDSSTTNISQLLEDIRRDRQALPPQSSWLDSTALIREDRDR